MNPSLASAKRYPRTKILSLHKSLMCHKETACMLAKVFQGLHYVDKVSISVQKPQLHYEYPPNYTTSSKILNSVNIQERRKHHIQHSQLTCHYLQNTVSLFQMSSIVSYTNAK